jgi:phosphonate transport system substrate-binding protein
MQRPGINLMRAARIFFLLGMSVLAACDNSSDKPVPLQYSSGPAAGTEKVYRLAVHPLHNPQKLHEAYQPLIDILNKQLAGARIELESSRDYQAFEVKIRARAPELLLPNPWQTLEALKVGYHVIATAGDAEDFKGLFIVRKDSGIKTPEDLKGKVVSYPSPTALAACIMPQYYLYTRGINVNTDIQNTYVGTQESSIMNAYLKHSAAGTTWPPPWRLFQKDHPEEAAQLEVIWETPTLINNSVMVREDVPAEVRELLLHTLVGLDSTPQGKAILAAMETARFSPADDATYQIVREYVSRFEREVRPVEKW